jgi:chorismate lyase/3-hydroxybenzoate synthase
MAAEMTPALETARSLTLRFGVDETQSLGIGLHVPVPVLAGPAFEKIVQLPATGVGETSRVGGFQILRHSRHLGGIAMCPIEGNLEATSFECYRTLFSLLGSDHHAYRIWHYVPAINERSGDLENYRIFNVGRRRAFDDHFGSHAEAQMPAASAVGVPGSHFIMAFVAGTEPPRFLENPQQTPAYHYPQSYGPKSPSFARASVAKDRVYISGTASIRGHETMHVGDIAGQLDVTVENLELLAKTLDYASWNDVAQQPGYALKVYLRHAQYLERIKETLAEMLKASSANTTILLADICRADLDLEIEAVFTR